MLTNGIESLSPNIKHHPAPEVMVLMRDLHIISIIYIYIYYTYMYIHCLILGEWDMSNNFKPRV